MVKPKISPDQIRASLHIGNPPSATSANDPGKSAASSAATLVAGETLIRLHIDSVMTYRRNPRQKLNERYLDIKESIRESGLDNMVKVTKRPGEDFYFPAAGGNTRILALKELYAETGDEKFGYVDFIFTEYKGEADVLTRHYIENDLRSDLIFWDKAQSLNDLKTEIETETGQSISSHRQFSEILAKRGIQIGREILRTYAFALEKLADLGAATVRLSSNNVRETILPNYQKLIRLVDKFGIKEDKFHEDVVRSVLRQAGERFAASQEFSLDELFRNLTDAAAALVNVDAANFRRMLSILEQRPDVTLSELTAPPDDPAAGGNQAASTTASSNPDAATDQSAGGSDLLTSDMNGNASAEQSDGSAAVPDLNTGGPRAGKSTEVLFANNLTPGDQTRQRQENPTGTLDLQGGGSTDEFKSGFGPSGVATSTSPMPSTAISTVSYGTAAGVDLREHFLLSLRTFAQVANLEDALRFDDSMPLWFYIELPATAEEGIPLDIESQAGGNPYRYMAWWYLANLCDVLNERSATRGGLPSDSPIATALADDEKWDDEVRNTVGEPLYHDTLGQLVNWMADPANPAGEALLKVMVSLRTVRASFDNRSSPSTAQEAA